MINFKGCKRCGGDLIERTYDSHGKFIQCFQCGHYYEHITQPKRKRRIYKGRLKAGRPFKKNIKKTSTLIEK